ncbi:MAG: SDR family oxidoreductase [Rhodospirillaceae bacterium]|nr:SDR family oxidoreductase [Rhodospirillaceae bacterium]
MELELAGKKALITGASEGIGRAIALRLAAEGCPLYLSARSADRLDSLKQETEALGVAVKTFPLDLSRSENQRSLSAACADADILVNSAGAIPNGTIDDIDEATWRAAFDLKVYSTINLCRDFYASMRKRGGGVIVNIIGNGGERPVSNYVAGACGNAAVMALTRALGGDSHKDNIRVVGINPGPVLTAKLERMMQKTARDRFDDESRYREFLDKFAFGRAATCEEIADMAAFLASPRSAYTTGTIVTIDGGMIYKGPLF